jgi:hypothetical protein
VLLHSDVFNPANKSKMDKAAYVRNTKLPGVSSEVLEVNVPPGCSSDDASNLVPSQYFYDNITIQPFKRANAHPDDFTSQESSLRSRDKDATLSSPSKQKRDLYFYIEQVCRDRLVYPAKEV